jgi:hypothetical protein
MDCRVEPGNDTGDVPALARERLRPESGFSHTNHQPSMAVSMHTIAGLI